jgi:hypothetical protein
METERATHIVFYNMYHLGDTFFAQPFLRNIMKNNPNYTYSFYQLYNAACYTDILSIQPTSNEIKEKVDKIAPTIDHTINHYFMKEDNILIINTWIGSLFKYSIIELEFSTYTTAYIKVIQEIKEKYNIHLEYDSTRGIEYPEMPPRCDISHFLEFKKIAEITGKKILFFNNFKGHSLQYMPFDYDNNAFDLAQILAQKYIVILGNNLRFNDFPDIYYANDILGISDDYTDSCIEAYQTAYMAYYSDISLYFDTGRSFIFFNKNFFEENNNNLRIHFSHPQSDYFNHISHNPNIPKNYVQHYVARNIRDIVHTLEQLQLL